MKTLLGSRRCHYLTIVGSFLLVVVLIAGIVGCDDGGDIQYDLSISSTSGGSVTTPGEGSFTYDEGTVVPLIAGADGDYQFVSWTGDVGTIADVDAATTNITMNSDYSITANFESIPLSAPCAPSEWTQADTPTMNGFVLAPESVIIDYALAADGEVAYAGVDAYDDICDDSSWVDHEHRLLKSDDHGATWTDLNEALEDVDESYDIQEIMRVATDWEDPDFVAVALYENSEVRVYFSTDGGDSFIDGEDVEDTVYFNGPADVSDLAVSPEAGGKRDIAIGGVGSDTYAALFRCTVTGDSASAWEDATNYTGWDNVGTPMTDIDSELVTDIIFSTSWALDKTILVTTVDLATPWDSSIELGTVDLQCGSFGTSVGWNADSFLGIDAVPVLEDIDLPMWLADIDGRKIAGLTLPADYNGKNIDDRVFWVWVNYYDPYPTAMCQITRVEDDSADPVGPLGQIENGELWLTNISYHGTIAEGEALAGVLGDGMGDYTYGCEGVQVYRNDGIRNMDICCEPWQDACKPPTGRNAMGVAYVDDDKAYAVALQGDVDQYDEGAFSVTFDDGDTWNQLSLIDTYIDYFSDVAVSPDCNKTFLVSINDYDGDCQCDSVWLHAVNLPEAEEYSGQWLRTWSGQLEDDWGLLRLPPFDAETTGDTVVLVDYGTDNVYINHLETLACWDPIGATELDDIVDLAMMDDETMFALDYNGDVSMFDGDEWQEAVDSELEYGNTIAVWGDWILVGGEDGDVSYSDDGGETFTELDDLTPIAGYVTVAFDSYFDQNSAIYAAVNGDTYPTTGGIYLWIIGESVDWTDIGACNDYAYNGIVLDYADGNPWTSPETGGVLYASYIHEFSAMGSYYETGVARCLTPVLEICCDVGEAEWNYLNESDPEERLYGWDDDYVRFRAWPDALKICGCLAPISNSKLFALDDGWDYDTCEGEDGTVWMFEDCFAKQVLELSSPVNGATITANPSTCFNVPFALYWDRLCDASAYDIQFALDEDFTLILETVNDYTPLALDAPNYLVAEGELSCEVTYYWRVRVAEDGTGQAIHSWWSEPWSFTVAP